jgi:hypothetical protein
MRLGEGRPTGHAGDLRGERGKKRTLRSDLVTSVDFGRRWSKDGKSFESTSKSIIQSACRPAHAHTNTLLHAHTHARTRTLLPAPLAPVVLVRASLLDPVSFWSSCASSRVARIPATTCPPLVALRSGSCANATCKLILVLLCTSSQPPASPPMSRPRPPRRPP